MKNLRELVKIKSDDSKEEIIKYIKEKFKDVSEEILIVKNEQDNNKSILIGINTTLAGVNPHRIVRTH